MGIDLIIGLLEDFKPTVGVKGSDFLDTKHPNL